MKILIVNTHDIIGGAARAAYRLHEALLGNGINSTMLVQNKSGNSSTVLSPNGFINKIRKKIKSTFEQSSILKCTKNTKVVFSTAWVPSGEIIKMINLSDADIIHLHWIHEGMVSIQDLNKIKKPIVWSLHDMWAFTGGCHYDEGCGRYKTYCHLCPILSSTVDKDLSYQVFTRKLQSYSKIKNLTIIGLSKWLAQAAHDSHLLQNRTIVNLPNPIDCAKMKPIDKDTAKEILGISKEKKLLLFGAVGLDNDPRKGFKELIQILGQLSPQDSELMIFGSATAKNKINQNFKIHYTGHLQDDLSLRLIYSAANIVIVPSLQENLSNIIMESLSCGTPVAAFNVGGNSDMVDHKNNGYLAKCYDTVDLINGIKWIIENKYYEKLCIEARKKIFENFDSKIVADKYVTLYTDILKNSQDK